MNDRWWEYYAVRYLVGTVAGALVAAFLAAQADTPVNELLGGVLGFEESPILVSIVFGAIGFAYCYIASAPMLALHATRTHLHLSQLNKRWVWGVATIVSFSGVTTALITQTGVPLLPASLIGLVVGIQMALLAAATKSRFTKVESFYRMLASVRQEGERTPTAGYVTSYRHLREHGNAMAILVLEAALAYPLYESPSVLAASIVLVVWVLPSTAAWVVGTVLEARLCRSPL